MNHIEGNPKSVRRLNIREGLYIAGYGESTMKALARWSLACFGRLLTMRRSLVILLLGLVLSFYPARVGANPIVFLAGRMRFVEYGEPYNKPIRLTMRCTSWMSSSRPLRKTCSYHQCTIGIYDVWDYSGGACDLEVKTADGRDFVLRNFPVKDGFVIGREPFWGVIDVGEQTVRTNDAPQPSILWDSYIGLFLMALLLTIVVETLVLFGMTRYWLKFRDLDLKKVFIGGGWVSLVTLPFMWFLLPKMWGWFGGPYMLWVGVGELAVAVIEALVYQTRLKVSRKSAIVLSFIANSASFLLGMIVF